jgi:hypothetical protein
MYKLLLTALVALSPSVATALDCLSTPIGDRIDERVRRGDGFSIGYGILSVPEILSCDHKDWTGSTVCTARQYFKGERMYVAHPGGGEAGEYEHQLRIRTTMYKDAGTMPSPHKEIWWPEPGLYLFWAGENSWELNFIDNCISGAIGPNWQQKQPIEHTLRALRNCCTNRRCSPEDIRVLNMVGSMY